ncbi:hypothetical protein PCASD_05507 [Puccinia coronata f. sp. avenae]|uniref:Uncharacterized protein n=1 Tax=Puccinia coronata f. sp. avenae TaxID=200324 RepID=A0A2N5V8Q4_9BASI|nr:hypothetical protein PCASD_05507 [Puccinia coronata f. sp. avenae]
MLQNHSTSNLLSLVTNQEDRPNTKRSPNSAMRVLMHPSANQLAVTMVAVGQVYWLTKLVPAQRAGLAACQAGTSPEDRSTGSPSWYQLSKKVFLLAKLVPVPAWQAA